MAGDDWIRLLYIALSEKVSCKIKKSKREIKRKTKQKINKIRKNKKKKLRAFRTFLKYTSQLYKRGIYNATWCVIYSPYFSVFYFLYHRIFSANWIYRYKQETMYKHQSWEGGGGRRVRVSLYPGDGYQRRLYRDRDKQGEQWKRMKIMLKKETRRCIYNWRQDETKTNIQRDQVRRR